MSPTYLHLQPGQAPPELNVGPSLTVIVADQAVDKTWLSLIAKWIVDSGSLYVVAWGTDCELWHDSVDWAVLEVFDFGEVPDERFIMTTWHDDEPLSEAFWFAGNCAHHPDVELTGTIILHVALEAEQLRILNTYHDSQTIADDK